MDGTFEPLYRKYRDSIFCHVGIPPPARLSNPASSRIQESCSPLVDTFDYCFCWLIFNFAGVVQQPKKGCSVICQTLIRSKAAWFPLFIITVMVCKKTWIFVSPSKPTCFSTAYSVCRHFCKLAIRAFCRGYRRNSHTIIISVVPCNIMASEPRAPRFWANRVMIAILEATRQCCWSFESRFFCQDDYFPVPNNSTLIVPQLPPASFSFPPASRWCFLLPFCDAKQ